MGLRDPSWSNEEDDDNFEGGKTDQEVGKYGFLERLEHYLDGELILDKNRKTVKLVVMVEVGAIVVVCHRCCCLNEQIIYYHTCPNQMINLIPETNNADL